MSDENLSLSSWREGKAKASIRDFVGRVINEKDPAFIPQESRIAVFDNDGTLWCEKPLPIQADFLLRRIGDQAKEHPSLCDEQPWKAVVEKDYKWLGDVVT